MSLFNCALSLPLLVGGVTEKQASLSATYQGVKFSQGLSLPATATVDSKVYFLPSTTEGFGKAAFSADTKSVFVSKALKSSPLYPCSKIFK